MRSVCAHVGDNRNDGAPLLFADEAYALSNRALRRPESPGAGGGNSHNRRARQISAGKGTTRLDRDVHHSKIVGRHDVQPKERRPFGRNINLEIALRHRAAERGRPRQSDSTHTRNSSCVLLQLAVERETPCRLVAHGGVGVDARSDDTFRLKAGIDGGQRFEAADEQAGGNHQQHRERDLGDGQRASESLRDRSSTAAAARFENPRQARPPRVNDRGEAKQTAGENRHGATEREYPPVHAHVGQSRRVRRNNELQPLGSLRRERETEQAAEACQEYALREELPGDAPRPGAESSACGDLPIARRCACQRQVGHIGAGDQQDHRDGTKQNQQPGARDGDQVPLQRYDTHVRIPAGGHLPRKQLQHSGLEQPNLDACLFDRRAGAEASDHRHVVTSPRVHDVTRIVVERNPELRLRRWETEIRRHDADNLPADAFELESSGR